MARDYETPEDYTGPDYEAWAEKDDHDERDRDEARLRRWEQQREMPYEDAPEHEDTIAHAMWLRREEYGDQDTPEMEDAA
jgi:hypothetical protein